MLKFSARAVAQGNGRGAGSGSGSVRLQTFLPRPWNRSPIKPGRILHGGSRAAQGCPWSALLAAVACCPLAVTRKKKKKKTADMRKLINPWTIYPHLRAPGWRLSPPLSLAHACSPLPPPPSRGAAETTHTSPPRLFSRRPPYPVTTMGGIGAPHAGGRIVSFIYSGPIVYPSFPVPPPGELRSAWAGASGALADFP